MQNLLRYSLLLLILAVTFVTGETEETIGETIGVSDGMKIWGQYGGPYGYYCGIMHTSRVFDRPINDVDRACQLHDTCISYAGKYLDCPCNEQLLLRMYNTCPVDDDSRYYRGQIINAMIVGTSMCSDYHCGLLNKYYISTELGFNAITFYGGASLNITAEDLPLLYALISNEVVPKFASANLLGTAEEYINSFKKMAPRENLLVNIPVDETLFIYNPNKIGATFIADV